MNVIEWAVERYERDRKEFAGKVPNGYWPALLERAIQEFGKDAVKETFQSEPTPEALRGQVRNRRVAEKRTGRNAIKCDAELLEGVLNLARKTQKDPKDIRYFSEALDRSEESIKKALLVLEDKGYAIGTNKDGKVWLNTEYLPAGQEIALPPGRRETFAVISDTHFGSRLEQITSLRDFIEYAYKQGVRQIFHAGDFVDGHRVYRGQEMELITTLGEEQVQHACQCLPRKPGLIYYIIGGSHDQSLFKLSGFNPMAYAALLRNDIKDLGFFSAEVTLGDTTIVLSHGTGKTPYAKSYPLQTRLRRFPRDKIPTWFFLGHYHSSDICRPIGIEGIMVPCWQGRTIFAKANDTYPEIGGFLVNYEKKNNLTITNIERRLYEEILDDWKNYWP